LESAKLRIRSQDTPTAPTGRLLLMAVFKIRTQTKGLRSKDDAPMTNQEHTTTSQMATLHDAWSSTFAKSARAFNEHRWWGRNDMLYGFIPCTSTIVTEFKEFVLSQTVSRACPSSLLVILACSGKFDCSSFAAYSGQEVQTGSKSAVS